MKKCNSCNIKFNINDKYCPLCQNILIGSSNEVLFPQNIRLKTNSILLKIMLFISIVTILISGFIEFMAVENFKITSYITFGLLTNYIVIYFILKSYKNIYKMLGKYGFVIILLLIMWYLVTKWKVIPNYIIPIVCMLELIFNFILCITLKRNYLIKYSGQLVMNIFLLLLPIIFVKLNLTTFDILSYICCLCAIISISGLLIFFFDDIKEELSKIFNI